MQFLSSALTMELHKSLIAQFGGLNGVRDKGLLESALAYPQLLYSISGEKDPYVLAAAYCYHLVANHPFLDGNKRIGALAMMTFLRMNNVPCSLPKDELYGIAFGVATSKVKESAIVRILKKYSHSTVDS